MNFKELDRLIHSGVKEIVLESDVILDDGEEETYLDGIALEDEIVIDGNNHAIDARGKVRIFDVKANLTVIKNTIFKNGNSELFGGAIQNQDKLGIENSRFENCYCPRGGAVANIEGKLRISNSQFINNSAYDGGAIYNTSGGYVFTGSIVAIEGCLFKDNHAKMDSGAIYSIGFMGIKDSKFESNSADLHGGAISSYQKSNMLTWQCEFRANSAPIGGCIFNFETLTVDKCLFADNSAEVAGGAIVNEKKSDLEIKDSSFRNNTSDIGGAVATVGPVEISDSSFENNSSKSVGGAIEIRETGKLKARNTSFRNNRSGEGGAIFTNSPDSIGDEGCEFEGNVPDDIN